MTKSYYTPVDFGVEVEQPKVEVVEVSLDIKEQLKAIRTELGLISNGQSRLIDGAIHFGARIYPHIAALKALEAEPNKETIRNFILLVQQDINRRVAQEFAKLFQDIDPELEKLL